MIKLSIPIILPFGFEGDIEKFKNAKNSIDINKLRELSKHNGLLLEYNLNLINGHPEFFKFDEIDHAWIKIPNRIINHYISRHDKTDTRYTLDVIIYTDIESISKEYSAPTDICNDIIFSLSIFLHGYFNIFGFIRFSPIILINDISLMFNSRLAYFINPRQDWFCDLDLLKILLSTGLKNQIKSKAKYYELIYPHVKKSIKALNLNNIPICKISSNDVDNILVFSRILSEIMRLHPSYDYSSILGLLTALIEGLLKIEGENRYKFKIKICNLMEDKNLDKALNEIYDSRSSFFHTAKYMDLKDIFQFLPIEFLLIVIKKIINYSIFNKIENSTFDFKDQN